MEILGKDGSWVVGDFKIIGGNFRGGLVEFGGVGHKGYRWKC